MGRENNYNGAMNWSKYTEAEGLTDELIRAAAAVAMLLVIISYLL